MTPKHKLELGLAQIFHQLMEKTIETIWTRKKNFQITYKVTGTETHEIILTVKKIEVIH